MSTAKGNGRQPTSTELMGYYLTREQVGSPAMSLGGIDRQLARFSLRDVFPALSTITAWADGTSPGDRREQLRGADRFFDGRVAERAQALLRNDPNAVLLSPQVAVNLAIRALSVCSNRRAEQHQGLERRIGVLLLALGEHLGTSHNTPGELLVELTRLSNFFSTKELAAWLELAKDLFTNVLPQLTAHPDWVDLDDLARAAAGMDLDRLWALTVIQGMHCLNGGHVIRAADQLGWNVEQAELDTWFDAWSLSAAEAAERAAHDVDVGTGWSFTAVQDRPIIRLDRESHVLPRPSWMARKGLPSEFFWQLREPHVARGGDHEALTRFFGAGIEQVGHHQLRAHLPPGAIYYNEDDIGSWSTTAGKRCDALIVDQDCAIALDFVFRQFTRATAQTGDLTDLAADLEKAVVKKVRQIDAGLDLAAQTNHLSTDRIFPLVVVGAPFPVNPLLYAHLDATLGGEALKVIRNDPSCRPVMVMDLASLYAGLRVAGSGSAFGDLLDEWLNSDLSGVPLRDWLAANGRAAAPDYTWAEFATVQLDVPGLAVLPPST